MTIEELFSDLVYSAFSPKIPEVLHRFPGWQCRIKFMWSEYILEQHHGLFFNFSSPLLWHNICGCYSVRFSCSPTSTNEAYNKRTCAALTNLWWRGGVACLRGPASSRSWARFPFCVSIYFGVGWLAFCFKKKKERKKKRQIYDGSFRIRWTKNRTFLDLFMVIQSACLLIL